MTRPHDNTDDDHFEGLIRPAANITADATLLKQLEESREIERILKEGYGKRAEEARRKGKEEERQRLMKLAKVRKSREGARRDEKIANQKELVRGELDGRSAQVEPRREKGTTNYSDIWRSMRKRCGWRTASFGKGFCR